MALQKGAREDRILMGESRVAFLLSENRPQKADS